MSVDKGCRDSMKAILANKALALMYVPKAYLQVLVRKVFHINCSYKYVRAQRTCHTNLGDANL